MAHCSAVSWFRGVPEWCTALQMYWEDIQLSPGSGSSGQLPVTCISTLFYPCLECMVRDGVGAAQPAAALLLNVCSAATCSERPREPWIEFFWLRPQQTHGLPGFSRRLCFPWLSLLRFPYGDTSRSALNVLAATNGAVTGSLAPAQWW